jgi:hypothetical protein
MKKHVKPLNQIHVVSAGHTSHFTDWESAVRFLWPRSNFLHAVREILRVGDNVVNELINEN